MTTLKQIKEIAAPLLASHSDLILHSCGAAFLVLKPVHHLIRYVVIDRTSSADWFRMSWAAVSSFGRSRNFGLDDYNRVIPARPVGSWKWSNPLIYDMFAKCIEEQALPKLRAVQTIDDYEAYYLSKPRDMAPNTSFRSIFAIARGDFDAAASLIDVGPRARMVAALNAEHDGLGDRLKARGSGISSDDKRLLVDMLHRWEAQTVRNLKLESVWEKTPFPVEETLV